MHDDESVEKLLRARSLRPEDAQFTARVLAALPPPVAARDGLSDAVRRSLVAAMRLGGALALLAVAQLWYVKGPGGLDALVAILLALIPAFFAFSLICGPLVPHSFLRSIWRSARDWR